MWIEQQKVWEDLKTPLLTYKSLSLYFHLFLKYCENINRTSSNLSIHSVLLLKFLWDIISLFSFLPQVYFNCNYLHRCQKILSKSFCFATCNKSNIRNGVYCATLSTVFWVVVYLQRLYMKHNKRDYRKQDTSQFFSQCWWFLVSFLYHTQGATLFMILKHGISRQISC